MQMVSGLYVLFLLIVGLQLNVYNLQECEFVFGRRMLGRKTYQGFWDFPQILPSGNYS